MAAVSVGGQWAIQATATKLSTILGITDESQKMLKRLSIKNTKGAANFLYIGNSDLTNTPTNAHIELDANQSYDFYSGEGWLVNTDDIYLVGTVNAANIAFINGMA